CRLEVTGRGPRAGRRCGGRCTTDPAPTTDRSATEPGRAGADPRATQRPLRGRRAAARPVRTGRPHRRRRVRPQLRAIPAVLPRACRSGVGRGAAPQGGGRGTHRGRGRRDPTGGRGGSGSTSGTEEAAFGART